MDFHYTGPDGGYTLNLESEDRSLRPRDAADEYLLGLPEPAEAGSILIAGDRCGALAVPLAVRCRALVNDSLTEQRQILSNLEANGCPELPFFTPEADLPLEAELILIKIPKSLEAFRLLLQRLSVSGREGCTVLAAGMSRYLPRGFFDLFREYCDEASYSRIEKKARYYRGVLKREPGTEAMRIRRSTFGWREWEFVTSPGVFSHGKLDGGSRMLLDWLYDKGREGLDAPEMVADPGCGSGVLGLCALKLWKEARLYGSDDSAAAVGSARENARRLGLAGRSEIRQDNILEGMEDGSAELVLCNPPFHRGHSISLETGFAFLKDSARVLKPGGMMAAVVNRSLGYGGLLDSLFDSVETVDDDRTYRLLLCRK